MPFPFSFRLHVSSQTYGLTFASQAKAILTPMRAALGPEGHVDVQVTDSSARLAWRQSIVEQYLRRGRDPYQFLSGVEIAITPGPGGIDFTALVQLRTFGFTAIAAVIAGLFLGLRGGLEGWVLVATSLLAFPIAFAWVRQQVAPWFLAFLLAPIEEASIAREHS